MRLLFFLLIPFISYSQVGQKLKLRQLEVGPPNAAVLTDSTGAIIFGAAESGGGTADGNGIYGGDGIISDNTYAEFSAIDDAFYLGYFPNAFSSAYTGSGFVHDVSNLGSIGMYLTDGLSNNSIEMFPASVSIAVEPSGGGTASGIAVTNQNISFTTSVPVNYDITINSTGIRINGGPYIISGTGDPNGSISAPTGSTFHRTDGGAGTSFYVKESGGTGNTGWVGK